MDLNVASHHIDQAFLTMVGQNRAKATLKRVLLGAMAQDGYMRPMCLTGTYGVGKSELISLFIRLSNELLKRKNVVFERGEHCGSPSHFLEEVLVRNISSQDANLVIDEFHEVDVGVMMMLRSLIEIKADRSARFLKQGDFNINFDLKKNGILVATNRVDKLDLAFMSRFERIDLGLYSDEELEAILQRVLSNSGIRFYEKTLHEIAACNRGTARDVVSWADDIKTHLAIADRSCLNKSDVREIIQSKNIFPLGVREHELKTLIHLEKRGEMMLKELAAANHISSKEQMEREQYLLHRGFLSIQTKRKISPDGRNYLAVLREDGYIPA